MIATSCVEGRSRCAIALRLLAVGLFLLPPMSPTAWGLENIGAEKWSFDKVKAGSLPPTLTVAETNGKGKPGSWKVAADPTAPSKPNVLSLASTKNSGSTYNLVVAEKTKYQDLEIKLCLRAMTGKQDQGGGPIWRARDAKNYYITRWNPLEDNLRLYYVKQGKRVQLASVEIKADPKAWHTLEVEHVEAHIEIEFDGKTVIEFEDWTFSRGGMVGLWTKADAATQFDDVQVKAVKGEKWTFDKARLDLTPAGFQIAETKGVGRPGTWRVAADPMAPSAPNVLALTKPPESQSTFNLLIARNTRYTDLKLGLRLKAVTGRIDRGGGPIWRAMDANNYYIARWNPLEDNLRLYYVKDGERVQLANADIKTDPKAWHSLEIKHVGSQITIEFDGEEVIVHDDTTFSEGGMVGLWTKADAATLFDNLKVAEAGVEDESGDADSSKPLKAK